MFEPTSRYQKALYALMAVTLPFTTYKMFKLGEWSVGSICAAWALIAIWYTVEWIIRRNPRDHKSAER